MLIFLSCLQLRKLLALIQWATRRSPKARRCFVRNNDFEIIVILNYFLIGQKSTWALQTAFFTNRLVNYSVKVTLFLMGSTPKTVRANKNVQCKSILPWKLSFNTWQTLVSCYFSWLCLLYKPNCLERVFSDLQSALL